MAASVIQTSTKGRAGGADSVTTSFGSLPTAGRAVVVYAWGWTTDNTLNFQTGTCTDNQGNTYSLAVQSPLVNLNIGGGTGWVRSAIFYALNIGSPSGTFTVTVNPAGATGTFVAAASEIDGLMTSGALDQTASSNNGGTGTTSPTSGTTATTAQPDELLVAAMVSGENSSTGTITVNASWTQRVEEVDNVNWQLGEGDTQIVSATGTYSCSWTTLSFQTSACIATFKAASTTPPQIQVPTSDTSVGTWTTNTGGTTNLYQAIDETTASDTDYVQSVAAPASAVYECGLGSATDPTSNVNHTVSVRALVDAVVGSATTLTTELRQGASALSTAASWQDTLTASAQTFTHTLSAAQADAITDYSALRLRFTADQPQSAPTLVGAGTAAFTATSGAAFAPGLPTGWAANDIHILVVHISSNGALAAPSGWTNLAALTGNNTTAQRVEVWWRRAVAGDAAPSLTLSSNTVTIVRGGRIYGIRGCPTSGSPFDTGTGAPTFLANAAAATIAFTDLTTTTANCFVLAVGAYEDDPTTITTMTNWTQPSGSVSGSTLGNDCMLCYEHRTLASAGAAGASSVTVSGGTFTNSPSVGVVLALLPVANNSRARVTWTQLAVPQAPASRQLASSAALSKLGTTRQVATAAAFSRANITRQVASSAYLSAPVAIPFTDDFEDGIDPTWVETDTAGLITAADGRAVFDNGGSANWTDHHLTVGPFARSDIGAFTALLRLTNNNAVNGGARVSLGTSSTDAGSSSAIATTNQGGGNYQLWGGWQANTRSTRSINYRWTVVPRPGGGFFTFVSGGEYGTFPNATLVGVTGSETDATLYAHIAAKQSRFSVEHASVLATSSLPTGLTSRFGIALGADQFTAANSTAINGRSLPYGSGTWNAFGATVDIQSNRAAVQANGRMIADVGAVAKIIEFTYVWSGSGSVECLFRGDGTYSNTWNLWYWTGSGSINLEHPAGGTAYSTGAFAPVTGTNVVRIIDRGTSFQTYLNGTLVFDVTGSNGSVNNTQTHIGFASGEGTQELDEVVAWPSEIALTTDFGPFPAAPVGQGSATLTETFPGADGASLPAAWTADSGTWEQRSGRAQMTADAVGGRATVSAGTADHEVKATLYNPSTTPTYPIDWFNGVSARVVDGNNLLHAHKLRQDGSNEIELRQVSGGTVTLIGYVNFGDYFTPSGSNVVAMAVNGAEVGVYVDGELVIQATTTLLTGTRVGIGVIDANPSGRPSWDNVEVRGTGTVSPTRQVGSSAALSLANITRQAASFAALRATLTRQVGASVALSLANIQRQAGANTALSLANITRQVATGSATSLANITRQAASNSALSLANIQRQVTTTSALGLTSTRAVAASSALLATSQRQAAATTALSLAGLQRQTATNVAVLSTLTRQAGVLSALSLAGITRQVPTAVAFSAVSARQIAANATFSGSLVRQVGQTASLSLANITRQVSTGAALQSTSTRTVAAASALQSTSTRTVATGVALQATLTREVGANADLSEIVTGASRQVAANAQLSLAGIQRQVASNAGVSLANIQRQVATNTALQSTLARAVAASTALRSTLSRQTGTATALSLANITRQVGATADLSETILGTYRLVGANAAFSGVATRTVATNTVLSLAGLQRQVGEVAALQTTLTRAVGANTAVLATLTRQVATNAAVSSTTQRQVAQSAAVLATATRQTPTAVALSLAGLQRQVPTSASISSATARVVAPNAAFSQALVTRQASAVAAVSLSGLTRQVATSSALLLQQARQVATTTAVQATNARLAASTVAVSGISVRQVQSVAQFSQADLRRQVVATATVGAAIQRTVAASVALLQEQTRQIASQAAVLTLSQRQVASQASLQSTLTRQVAATVRLSLVGNVRRVATNAIIAVSHERLLASSASFVVIMGDVRHPNVRTLAEAVKAVIGRFRTRARRV